MELFVPFAEKHHVDAEKPIVLTYDGHDSHETDMMMKAAYKHGVICHAFPSKVTHKMQPLDVGVFSSVQHAWSKHCDKHLAEGIEIDRYNFIHEYMSTQNAITLELIKNTFKKTGLYPLNPSVFTERDFAPSMASSSKAHMPSSYPTKFPSSPFSFTTDTEMDVDDLDLDASARSGDQEAETDSEDDEDYIPGNEEPEEGNSSDIELESDGESILDINEQETNEENTADTTTDDPEPAAAPTPIQSLPQPLASSSTTHSNESATHVTRSSSPLSEPLPVPFLPPYSHAMSLSKDALWNQLQQMYHNNKKLLEIIQMLTAQLQSANAHCTLCQ